MAGFVFYNTERKETWLSCSDITYNPGSAGQLNQNTSSDQRKLDLQGTGKLNNVLIRKGTNKRIYWKHDFLVE